MKHICTTIALVFVMTMASCQEIKKKELNDPKTVPVIVLKGFQEKYPEEKSPDFEVDAHGYWEAHFKMEGEKYRADFNTDGTWRETENSIKISELPTPILEKLKADYDIDNIAEVEHVMSATKGEFYDVEFKQKGKNKDIEFRKDGTVIN